MLENTGAILNEEKCFEILVATMKRWLEKKQGQDQWEWNQSEARVKYNGKKFEFQGEINGEMEGH